MTILEQRREELPAYRRTGRLSGPYACCRATVAPDGYGNKNNASDYVDDVPKDKLNRKPHGGNDKRAQAEVAAKEDHKKAG